MDNMLETDTFQTPARQQTACPLLSLPAELRVKVLRMLMKSPDPIIPFRRASDYYYEHEDDDEYEFGNDYQTRDSYLDSLCMSAQVLSSCRQLCSDGMHVLYGENTLQVKCTQEEEHGLDILAGRVELHPQEPYWSALDTDMIDTARAQLRIAEEDFTFETAAD